MGLFVLIPGLWGLTVVLVTEKLHQTGVLLPRVPRLAPHPYWGVAGWLVLAIVTFLGANDLASDIAALR